MLRSTTCSGGDKGRPPTGLGRLLREEGKKKKKAKMKIITPQQPGRAAPFGLCISSWFVYFQRICSENIITAWLLFSLPRNFPLPSSRPLIGTGLIRFGWLESCDCALRRGHLP